MLKKIPRSYKLLFWIPEPGLLLALFLDCENFALPAGGTVPRYQHSACVGVAFGVNYWQSTNSYEVILATQTAPLLLWGKLPRLRVRWGKGEADRRDVQHRGVLLGCWVRVQSRLL